MELIMAAQEDATPWEIPPETDGASTNMLGRGYFSNLGIVRRKPSRPDAPPSLSKSCSDKIAVKQYISLVSSVTSLLVSPANTYLTSLVLPKVQYVEEAVQRCFGAEGRLQGLQGRTVGPYSFRPFQVLTTQKEFAYSRRDMAGNLHTGKILPSNIAAAWNPYIEETIIGGVLQGRKQNDPNGGSALSRRRLWALLHEISAAPLVQIREVDSVMTYQDIKQKTALALRAKAKETLQTVLPGWVSNVGDNSFSLK
jgi:tRNA-specific adenosine deaminase 1